MLRSIVGFFKRGCQGNTTKITTQDNRDTVVVTTPSVTNRIASTLQMLLTAPETAISFRQLAGLFLARQSSVHARGSPFLEIITDSPDSFVLEGESPSPHANSDLGGLVLVAPQPALLPCCWARKTTATEHRTTVRARSSRAGACAQRSSRKQRQRKSSGLAPPPHAPPAQTL